MAVRRQQPECDVQQRLPIQVNVDQRQDRIDERTTSIATLQTPLNLALAAYLLPHAETGQSTSMVENLNVQGANITLDANGTNAEVGDSGEAEYFDLSATGSIDDLTAQQRWTVGCLGCRYCGS